MISVAGGILGLALANLLCDAARRGPIAFDQVRHLSIRPEVGLLCLGIAAAVGLISAFAPAYAAARTPIVEAVRNAG
jgi:ABC-type antimicrobial peptide transport system permease subunit